MKIGGGWVETLRIQGIGIRLSPFPCIRLYIPQSTISTFQQIHVFVMHLMFSIKWDLSCEQLISQHHSEYETNHLQKILCYIAYIVDFVVVRAVDWIRMTPLSSELLISMERMLNWECKAELLLRGFCFWLFEVARDERYFAFIFIHAKASNHCVCAPKPKPKHLAVAENVKNESKIPRCHSKLI